jgi:putative flippase GtrA
MRRLFGNRAFSVGCIVGFLFFVLTAEYIDKKNRPICFDCAERFGFPFAYLETGGQAFSERIVWSGLIADLLIAFAFSFIIGAVVNFIWSRFIQNERFSHT